MTRLKIAATLACLAVAPLAVSAQETPVVFAHGLAGSAGTWKDTADRLHARSTIERVNGDLPWREHIETQAAHTRNLLPTLRPAVAIGHSNGGLVMREWSKTQILRGLVTVGTPNSGAPLVTRINDVIGFNQRLHAYAGFALGSFGIDPRVWEPVYTYVYWAIVLAQQVSASTVSGLAVNLGIQSQFPVLNQMYPGSGFLLGLNSPGNLAREAAIPARVGLVFSTSPFMGPARAIAPDFADHWDRQIQIAISTMFLAAQYIRANTPPTNTTAWMIADNLELVALTSRQIDSVWCWAVTNDSSCRTASDAVVPSANQVLPGATRNILIHGVAHTQEARYSEEVLFDVLTNTMGIPRRGGAAAPTPAPPRPAPPTGPPGPNQGGSGGLVDTLYSDECLASGQYLQSADGRFSFVYQGDGNVVLYQHGTPLWESGAWHTAGALCLQSDGNLVAYRPDGTPAWHTNTHMFPGASLSMQSDGNAVVYSYNGRPVWATDTGGR